LYVFPIFGDHATEVISMEKQKTPVSLSSREGKKRLFTCPGRKKSMRGSPREYRN